MSEGKVYTMKDVANPVDESVINEAAKSATFLADMRDAKFCSSMFQVERGLPFGSARIVPDGAKQYGWFVRDIQVELADCVIVLISLSHLISLNFHLPLLFVRKVKKRHVCWAILICSSK